MNDPITTYSRTNPNPTTIGEIMDWLQVQMDAGVVSRKTPIKTCEVALRIKQEACVTHDNYWLHVAAENRTYDGDDLGTNFKQLEVVLHEAYRSKLIPNTEFSLHYEDDDGSGGWVATAGNPRPKDGPIQQVGGVFLTKEFETAEGAVEDLISQLLR